MWKFQILQNLILLMLGCSANTHSSAKPTTTKLVFHSINLNSTSNVNSNSSICDSPSPTIEPEMCCEFPNFFNESIIEKCEIDFALAEKSSANLITDTVNIFNQINYFY